MGSYAHILLNAHLSIAQLSHALLHRGGWCLCVTHIRLALLLAHATPRYPFAHPAAAPVHPPLRRVGHVRRCSDGALADSRRNSSRRRAASS